MKTYTPKQVAEMFGVNAMTIRRYEKFGIIPMRLPSGYRKYTDEDIEKIKKLFNNETKNL